jgi:hypothetical protein
MTRGVAVVLRPALAGAAVRDVAFGCLTTRELVRDWVTERGADLCGAARCCGAVR